MNSKEKRNSDKKVDGCLKQIGIAAAVILLIVLIGGALDGIENMFSKIPWYGHVILSIGFIYIMYRISSGE